MTKRLDVDNTSTEVTLGEDGTKIENVGPHVEVTASGAYVNVRGADPVLDDDLATKRYVDTTEVTGVTSVAPTTENAVALWNDVTGSQIKDGDLSVTTNGSVVRVGTHTDGHALKLTTGNIAMNAANPGPIEVAPQAKATGPGENLVLQGGGANDADGGVAALEGGSSILFKGGDTLVAGGLGVPGGNTSILGGDGIPASSGEGGSVIVQAGTGDGVGPGGELLLKSGVSGATAPVARGITIEASDATDKGGDVYIRSGGATGGGGVAVGGDVGIESGPGFDSDGHVRLRGMLGLNSPFLQMNPGPGGGCIQLVGGMGSAAGLNKSGDIILEGGQNPNDSSYVPGAIYLYGGAATSIGPGVCNAAPVIISGGSVVNGNPNVSNAGAVRIQGGTGDPTVAGSLGGGVSIEGGVDFNNFEHRPVEIQPSNGPIAPVKIGPAFGTDASKVTIRANDSEMSLGPQPLHLHNDVQQGGGLPKPTLAMIESTHDHSESVAGVYLKRRWGAGGTPLANARISGMFTTCEDFDGNDQDIGVVGWGIWDPGAVGTPISPTLFLSAEKKTDPAGNADIILQPLPEGVAVPAGGKGGMVGLNCMPSLVAGYPWPAKDVRAVVDGDIQITGLVDPTGVQYTPQGANPGHGTPEELSTTWVNTADGELYLGNTRVGGGGNQSGGGHRLTMNPGKWYDNGDGLGTADVPEIIDTVASGHWYAVPFRVDHPTDFSEIGVEVTGLAGGQGTPLGFAIYNDDVQPGVSGPGSLFAYLGVVGIQVGANILNFASSPVSLMPGWYWLAMCHTTNSVRTMFRQFNVRQSTSTTGSTVPYHRNNNTAHLGYMSVLDQETAHQVRTTSGGFNGGQPAPGPFPAYEEMVNINPTRLMLRVIGGQPEPPQTPRFLIPEVDGAVLSEFDFGILLDSGGEDEDYGPSESYSVALSPNVGLEEVVVLYDTEANYDFLKFENRSGETIVSLSGYVGSSPYNLDLSPFADAESPGGYWVKVVWESDSVVQYPGFTIAWNMGFRKAMQERSQEKVIDPVDLPPSYVYDPSINPNAGPAYSYNGSPEDFAAEYKTYEDYLAAMNEGVAPDVPDGGEDGG